MDIATIIARNYLPYARVLAASFREHHPRGDIYVFVIDQESRSEADEDEPFIILHPDDLGISLREYHRMATIYDVMELATAIKPWVLAALLDRGCGTATYLDPDIEVFDRLDEVDRLAREHGLVLIPHTGKPMRRDGMTPTESDILISGVFNLGFISVSPDAAPFLDWWMERLALDCIVDIPHGLFVDQRWVDLATQIFDHVVLRDAGYNVAYWNVDQRPLTKQAGRFLADGQPLRFFHYSGFDASVPGTLSKHQRGIGRVQPDDDPILKELCDRYSRRLLAAAGPEAGTGYAYARSTAGLVLDHEVRRGYRDELLHGSVVDLPDPFDERDSAAFAKWVATFQRQAALRSIARPIRRRAHSLAQFGFALVTAVWPSARLKRRARQERRARERLGR